MNVLCGILGHVGVVRHLHETTNVTLGNARNQKGIYELILSVSKCMNSRLPLEYDARILSKFQNSNIAWLSLI